MPEIDRFRTEDRRGVDTLYRRPIFNTRDEPHADAAKWLRLHVICGDANRSEWNDFGMPHDPIDSHPEGHLRGARSGALRHGAPAQATVVTRGG